MRRTWIDEDERLVVVESVVVPKEVVPSISDTSNIRVATYSSRMIIRAHGDWNEHGLGMSSTLFIKSVIFRLRFNIF